MAEDPNIATLREALAALQSELYEVADYEEAEWRGNLRKAGDSLSALATTLAESSELEDRIRTILDEAVSMQPVMPAQEALTLLEEHVHSLRMAVEIAQRREPTQAEGDAHEDGEPSHAQGECFIPAGGWTGRRCRVCNRWVWGGPTACAQCAEQEAALAERDEALDGLRRQLAEKDAELRTRLRSEALRALETLEQTSQLFDEGSYYALRSRIEKGEF